MKYQSGRQRLEHAVKRSYRTFEPNADRTYSKQNVYATREKYFRNKKIFRWTKTLFVMNDVSMEVWKRNQNEKRT